ncbi:MAG: hypothetical protein V1647_04695, partial [Pseudomonadota bacterium]
RDICYSYGHGEPDLDDQGENGLAIFDSLMYARGINFVPVTSAAWDTCGVLVIVDPKKEMTGAEIKKLSSFEGVVIFLGGNKLSSLREYFSKIGISAFGAPVQNLEQALFRDYDGGVLIDRVAEHPVFKNVSGGVVSGAVYELNCSNCQKLAAVHSDKDKKDKTVLVIKDNIIIFSGERTASNFFMRFKGNMEFLSGLINFVVSPDLAVYLSLQKSIQPVFFAVSPRYLDIIFIIVVIIIPAVFLGGIFNVR